MSWLYSFYCFEYRWVFEGKTISKEIKKLEQNAVYYLGFGLPFALITYSFPGLIGNGIWALLFPLFMVTALLSKTPIKASRKIPVFTIPSYICDKIEIMLSSKKS
jgi:etoposide-induced 2.4 mRNA